MDEIGPCSVMLFFWTLGIPKTARKTTQGCSRQWGYSPNFLPSGKHHQNYGTSPFLWVKPCKSTVSMAIFNTSSYVCLPDGMIPWHGRMVKPGFWMNLMGYWWMTGGPQLRTARKKVHVWFLTNFFGWLAFFFWFASLFFFFHPLTIPLPSWPPSIQLAISA